MKVIRKTIAGIGSAIIWVLDIVATVLAGVLFGIVFIGAQVASWTGSEK